MRGKIAVTGFPFESRIRIGVAKSPRRQFHDAIAAVALLHDLVTSPPIVPTASFCHEGTVSSSLQRCTIHSDYLQKNDLISTETNWAFINIRPNLSSFFLKKDSHIDRDSHRGATTH
jgi:hypothetical protein